MRRMVWLACVVWLAALSTLSAAAGRVALVIGNGAYTNATVLPNPTNDAADMTAALQGLGFTVIGGTDLDHASMGQKIGEFEDAAREADVTLLFYAGHGMQVNGRNYLVPVNAKLERESALQFEAIDAETILRSMAGPGKTAIALLDACRDNPLSRRFARSLGTTRSNAVQQGLAVPAISGGGMLIGFATAPGDVAADGDGRNSPFTTALLKNMKTPGLEIQQLMTRVKADVFSTTKETQEPWHNSSLRNEIYLVPASIEVEASPAKPQAAPQGASIEFEWNAIKNTSSPAVLEAFMAKHADNPLYMALADELRNKLQGNGAGAPAKTEEAPAEKLTAAPEGDSPPDQSPRFDVFLEQALDVVNGTSTSTAPLQALNLLKPAGAPGSKTPKLNLRRVATAPSFSDLRTKVATTPDGFEDFATCRTSNLSKEKNGCDFMSDELSSTLYDALAERGLNTTKSPAFDMVKIEGTEDFIFSSRPKFGDGEIGMAVALVAPDLTVKKSFRVDVSKSRFGIDAADKETRIQVTGAAVENDELYVSFDSGFRCKGGKPVKRTMGLLLRAQLSDLTVTWISPFNVSDVNFVMSSDKIFTATVGSCAPSFIYVLDKNSGQVTARMTLPNGADKLMQVGNELFVQHYPAASVYGLKIQ
jgi:hypothetical protein